MKVSCVLLVAAAVAAALGFVSEARAGEPGEPGKKVARMFRVPPDFTVRGGPPAYGRERYPHVIQALGPEPPIDARPVLTDLGVVFDKGDAALISTQDRSLLFVMASQSQVDVVETIMDTMGGPGEVIHVHAAWLMRQTDAKGRVRDLLERSIIIRSGHRSAFERRLKGQTVEKAEVEVSVGEAGEVDMNASLQLQFKDLKVQANGQALMRDGDNPVVFYTTAGRAPRSKLEVLISARVMRELPGDDSHLYHTRALPPSKMVDLVAAEVAAVEADPPAAVMRMDAIAVHLGDLVRGGPGVEVKFSNGRSGVFVDVTEAFGELLPFKVEKGRAWYCWRERVLFLHAEERTILAAYGMALRQGQEGPGQYELKLSASETKGGKEQSFPPRTLLIRAGQRSKGTAEFPSGREETEAELSVNHDRTIADLNVAVTGAVFGRETWTFTTLCMTATNGTTPATLVTGRAADAGGGFKRLQATVDYRGDRWQELLRHPKRRAEAIAAMEAALVKK